MRVNYKSKIKNAGFTPHHSKTKGGWFFSLTSFFRTRKSGEGFTLLEILLVVAAIAILATIVIRAINPQKQLGDTRNAQRGLDVNTILNAVYQYAIDNGGNSPVEIPLNEGDDTDAYNYSIEICLAQMNGEDCPDPSLIDLSALTTNRKYLTSIPRDPSGGIDNYGTGYFIVKDQDKRITIFAPRSLDDGANEMINVSL